MSNTFILLLGQSPAESLRWGRIEEGALVAGGRLNNASELAGISVHAAGADIVAALLPGEQVALRRLPAPPRQAAKFYSAASLLLEDELAGPIEHLHVATAIEGDDGLVVAVKSSVLELWMGAFAEAGISPTLATADYLALSSSRAHGTMIFEKDRVIVAAAGWGFAAERDLYATIAARAFNDPPAKMFVLGGEGDRRLAPPTSQVQWLGPADDAQLLLHYAECLASRAPPNLLQGRFRKRRNLAPIIAPWRRSAVLAGAAVAALALFVVADAVRATRLADRYADAGREAHAAAFPDAASEDPVAHARRVLGAGGERSFLSLSGRFAAAVAAVESVQIDRISFDAARAEMVVSVRSTSDVDIETLKTRLAESGVVARDNGGYRRAGAFWIGELAAATQ